MVAGGYPSDDEEQLIQNQGPMGGADLAQRDKCK